jgi:hypothetical protein
VRREEEHDALGEAVVSSGLEERQEGRERSGSAKACEQGSS